MLLPEYSFTKMFAKSVTSPSLPPPPPSPAGSDYQSVQAAELTYSSSSSRNQTFSVTILPDVLTELTESFVAVITGIFLRDGGGAQLSLTRQESDRIQVRIPEAEVFILNINGWYN